MVRISKLQDMPTRTARLPEGFGIVIIGLPKEEAHMRQIYNRRIRMLKWVIQISTNRPSLIVRRFLTAGRITPFFISFFFSIFFLFAGT